MLDRDLLGSIAIQLMSGDTIEVKGKSLSVGVTAKQRLKTVSFTMKGREYQAIEQNPNKMSAWDQLARGGHQVVQFKDAQANKLVAVAVDGKVREYERGSRRDPHRTEPS